MNVDDLAAAVLSPHDGWLDPHSLLMGFAHQLRHEDATIETWARWEMACLRSGQRRRLASRS